MSLINRMLSDLEERRGGNLRNVDRAIDGLRATQGPAPRRKKRIAPATVATGCVIVGLMVLCGYLFVSRPSTSTMVQAPAATPVPEPAVTASTPVTVPQPPASAAPAAAAPSVAPQPMPVVITDTPPAAAEPVERAAEPPPAAPRTETPLPEPARDIAAAWPEPEPEPEPARAPPKRQRMLSTGSSGERQEPLVDTEKRAPPARERPSADSSFHIAETTPRSTADEALALLEEGDSAAAESLLRDGLANAPGDSDMARVLGHILLARNDASAAVRVLRPAAPTVEADPDFNALLAAAEQRSGAHDQAIRRYRSLLERTPGNGAWLVGLGISLRANGDAKAASDAFLQALADTSLPAPLHDFAMQQATQVREGQP